MRLPRARLEKRIAITIIDQQLPLELVETHAMLRDTARV
jgi:hypothetical protein